MEFDFSSSSVSSEYRPVTYQSKSQPVCEDFRSINENFRISQLNKFSQEFWNEKFEKTKNCWALKRESLSDEKIYGLESSKSKVQSEESIKKPDLTYNHLSMPESVNETFENTDKKMEFKEVNGGISSISRMISSDKSKFFEVDDSIDKRIFSLEGFSSAFQSSSIDLNSFNSASSGSKLKPITDPLLSSQDQSTSKNPSISASNIFHPATTFSFQTPFAVSDSKNIQKPLNSFWNTTPQSSNPKTESSTETKSNFSSVNLMQSVNKHKKQDSFSSDWSELLEYGKAGEVKFEDSNFTLDSSYPNQITEVKAQQPNERRKFKPVQYWKNEEFSTDTSGNIVSVNRKNGNVATGKQNHAKTVKNLTKSEKIELGPVNGLNVWFFPKENWKVEDFEGWKQGLVLDNGTVRAKNIMLKGGCEFSECCEMNCVVRMIECTKFGVIFELEGMKNYFNKEDLAYISKGCKFTVLNLSQKVVKMLVFQF